MSLWSNFIQWFLPPPGSAPSSLTQVMKENPKPKPAAKPKKTGIEIHKEEKAAAKKPKPAPKPRAKKKAAPPKETEENLNKMTKANIQALAKKNLKLDLDSKLTKKVMIENFISAQKG